MAGFELQSKMSEVKNYPKKAFFGFRKNLNHQGWEAAASSVAGSQGRTPSHTLAPLLSLHLLGNKSTRSAVSAGSQARRVAPPSHTLAPNAKWFRCLQRGGVTVFDVTVTCPKDPRGV
eukprot:2680584-Prymnesium_polylepis.2